MVNIKTRKALEESNKLIALRGKIINSVRIHGAKLAKIDNSSELLDIHHRKTRVHTKNSHKNATIIIKEIIRNCDELESSLKAQLLMVQKIKTQALKAYSLHSDASR